MTDSHSAIHTDAPNGTHQSSEDFGGYSLDDATSAFLNRWNDRSEDESVSEHADGSTDTDPDETQGGQSDTESADENVETTDEDSTDPSEDDQQDTENETDEEQEEDEGEEDNKEENPKTSFASDDMKVSVTVDGQELEVSVKDLKRLYGQEAALTRKSQEVAAARKKAEEEAQRYTTGLSKLVEKAAARYKPYSEIDMLTASKHLNAKDFAQLRAEAKAAWEDFNFLTQELDTHIKSTHEQFQNNLREKAQEAVKTITNEESPYHIPNWSSELYNDLRSYATEKGLNASFVNTLTDPAAWKIIHTAMQAERAKEISTKKVAKVAPKKVVKTKAKSTNRKGGGSLDADAALTKLRNTGSIDDAAEAFLAKWGH